MAHLCNSRYIPYVGIMSNNNKVNAHQLIGRVRDHILMDISKEYHTKYAQEHKAHIFTPKSLPMVHYDINTIHCTKWRDLESSNDEKQHDQIWKPQTTTSNNAADL